jgi:hypothetical protein
MPIHRQASIHLAGGSGCQGEIDAKERTKTRGLWKQVSSVVTHVRTGGVRRSIVQVGGCVSGGRNATEHMERPPSGLIS